MIAAHDPRKVLEAHGLWTKKHFGQNFLIDPTVPPRIAAVGGAGPDDVIFEIGAGVATLTRALAGRAKKVIALEYDRELVPVARVETAFADEVEIREGDVRHVDWAAEAAAAGQPLVIYGNLPYHLSTDILMGLLDAPPGTWRRACFLLQTEFAERAAAAPGTRECSALSARVALATHATLAFGVPRTAFHPAPKVESAVLVLERRDEPAVDVGDPRAFRHVVRALFAQRRKMARKALKPVCADPAAVLAAADIPETVRGEALSLEQLGALSRALVAWRATQGASGAVDGGADGED
ncbi:MAG: ribosomal RNA small subunit methyltransferase A [Myxococcales bacterium]|nr:ribosomal RNA small subunit methyltransferase A [Myxococcales bacterium]